MPLHLQQLSDKEINLFSQFISKLYKQNEGMFYITNDEKYTVERYDLINQLNNEFFGKLFITYDNMKKTMLDIDMVLNNDDVTNLKFMNKLDVSNEKFEYYVVEDENKIRFLAETASRYVIEKDTLTYENVKLSAFPFELEVYDTIEEVNHALGVQDSDIFRFEEGFINPMSLFEESDETYSCFIGKIEDFEKVSMNAFGNELYLTIAYLKTYVGIIPALISNEYYDKLEKGKLILAYADIKADLDII